jgi:TorA maturation chaperone TorD
LRNDRDPAVFRSTIYRILAAAFSPPKADMSSLYEALLEMHASLRSTKTPLEVIHASENPSLPALAKEHLRLFVGPGHIPCPPYEAVYRKDRPDFEKGLVMGPSTADVRRAYFAAGLDISKTYTDLPDHIAAEMEFMQFLCAEETRLAQQGNNEEAAKMKSMQQEFHKNHIEPWVEDFADCILRSTTSPFYKATASVLKEFAKSEAGYLAEAL